MADYDIATHLRHIEEIAGEARDEAHAAHVELKELNGRVGRLEEWVRGPSDDNLREAFPGLLGRVTRMERQVASARAVVVVAWTMIAVFGPGLLAIAAGMWLGGAR